MMNSQGISRELQKSKTPTPRTPTTRRARRRRRRNDIHNI
jgi:hypothetical protein